MSKTKKTCIAISSFLVLGLLLAHWLIPTFIDKKFNSIEHPAPYKISEQAQSIYTSLKFIADLHSDVLLWQRDILEQHQYGHEDIPRMLSANLAFQAFTIVNKVPRGLNFKQNRDDSDQLTLIYALQGRPLNSWFDLTERVIVQTDELKQFSADSNGQLKIIYNKSDLSHYLNDRKNNPLMTAGMLGIEGAQALEGQLGNIDRVYQAGVRMVGLTHFFDNELGGSAHGVNRGGITEFGRAAVLQMQDKNMLIDLAHASPALVDDVLAIARKPVIVSHTGVKGTCDNNRNLSDRQLRMIADNGGIVGIAMFQVAVCGQTPEAIAKAIFYTANLIGTQHVALGSDFDGAVHAIIEVRGLPLIVEALLKLGMKESDIRQVMGENVRNFLLTNLPD